MHYPGESGDPTAGLSSFGDSYLSSTSPGMGVSCVWGDHNQRLREILADNPLPQIVKICEEDVVQSNGDGNEGFNFRQPLLLYSEVRMKRIFARNLKQEAGHRSREKEVGPYVVIPEDYPGLFRILDEESHGDASLTSLSTVARIMPGSFLSTQKLKGFEFLNKRNDTLIYEKKEVPAGVYYVRNIHEDQLTYINSRKSEKRKLLLCLRCVNEDKSREVLLPYDTTGQFYVIDLKKNNNKSCVENGACVYRILNILELLDKDKNTKIELVYGDPPSQECHFSGILRLSHVTKEHTVIACTLNSEEPKILELAVAPHPKFRLGLQTADKRSDEARRQCLAFMKTAFVKFRRDLKIRRDYEIEKRDLREEY